jgi:hypothetical protein
LSSGVVDLRHILPDTLPLHCTLLSLILQSTLLAPRNTFRLSHRLISTRLMKLALFA